QRDARDCAVLADPSRTADRPKPPLRRLRVDRRAAGSVPGLLGRGAEGQRTVPEGAPAQRVLDLRDRQVAPEPEQGARPGGARPVRSTGGRADGASTTSGASSPASPASTTR